MGDWIREGKIKGNYEELSFIVKAVLQKDNQKATGLLRPNFRNYSHKASSDLGGEEIDPTI